MVEKFKNIRKIPKNPQIRALEPALGPGPAETPERWIYQIPGVLQWVVAPEQHL